MKSQNKPHVLGLIGIRSGSKGVPDKNILKLGNKPLVAWIIDAANKSSQINRVIVSSDSKRYAEIAKNWGAEAPFLRPLALADDFSTDYDYVRHTLDWLSDKEKYQPEIVVRLMATVPFQTSGDIDAAVTMLKEDPTADSVVIISEARQHPLKALRVIHSDKNARLLPYFGESGRDVTGTIRQSYEKAYFRANVIAFRRQVVYETKSLTGEIVRPYIIPQERAIDIDSKADFALAEQVLANGFEFSGDFKQ